MQNFDCSLKWWLKLWSFNTLWDPCNEKVAKLWGICQRKNYRCSNSDNSKSFNRKNGDFGPFFGQKPSEKSKVDNADQIFCVVSLTRHIWHQKNSRHSRALMWLELIFEPHETKTWPEAWMLSQAKQIWNIKKSHFS